MNRIENGLHPLRVETLDRALDDVVAVLMPGQFLDPGFQLLSEFVLLVTQDMLQCILNYSAGVHLCGQAIHLGLQLVGQRSLLSLVAMIEQLLNHPIAKEIFGQLDSLRQYFLEQLFFFVAVGGFYSALKKAGAVLVATEFYCMAGNVLSQISCWSIAEKEKCIP